MIKLDNGWKGTWSKATYVFDENDSSKDIVEGSMSKEIENFLAKEKQRDLKYDKEEAQKAINNL